MIFPHLKNKSTSKTNTRSLEEFNAGINDDKGDYVKSGNILRDCENMQFSGGLFRTRAGFAANAESLVAGGERDIIVLPFTVTETVCHYNSKAYNIAYCCFGGNDDCELKFYLVDPAGNILPAGGIYYHRVDANYYYLPVNVLFTVAEPVSGCGVFAAVERASGDEHITDYIEAKSDFSAWLDVKGSYYIPTVRINGRGERYDEADEYSGLKLAAPERPEELNLLTGRHKSYFTSDGFSAIFRLPYGNIAAESNFICRVYTSPGVYTEWSVGWNESSAAATFLGAQVTLTLNRTLGVMRFTKNSADYSIPLMENCSLNNMEIIAVTAESGNEAEISSCKGAVALDGRLYVYGGARKNCVYCARQSKPLYFPQSNKVFLGDGGTAVTAIRVQNGKLIAFKPSETYRIITYFDKETFEKETVLPEQTTYIKGDTLGMQTIDNGIGCAAPATVRLCGNRLVWLGEDNCVYALATTTYGNTTNIYKVSQPLGNRLSAAAAAGAQAPFAVTEGGMYMLFIGGRIFVMNFRVRGFGYSKTYYAGDDEIKSPAWYIWLPPEGAAFEGGSVVGGRAVLVYKIMPQKCFCTAATGGECDLLPVIENGAFTTVTKQIKSGFKTKIFDFENAGRLKRFDSIFISGESSAPVNLTVNGGSKSYTAPVTPGAEGYVRLSGGIPATGELSFDFKADEPFGISNIGIKYKLIGDRG